MDGGAVGALIAFLALSLAVGGLVGYLIGRTKGRPGLGLVLGAVLGVIGWLIVALLPRTAENEAAHYQHLSALLGQPPAEGGAVDETFGDTTYQLGQVTVIAGFVVALLIAGRWLLGRDVVFNSELTYRVGWLPVAAVFAVPAFEGFADPFRRFPKRGLGVLSGVAGTTAALVALRLSAVASDDRPWGRTMTMMSLALLVVGGVELYSWMGDPDRRGGGAVAAAAGAALIAGTWMLTQDHWRVPGPRPELPMLETRAILYSIALLMLSRSHSTRLREHSRIERSATTDPGLPAAFAVAGIESVKGRPKEAVAEPQWLPDPFGRHDHRYFNGRSWTDKVADAGISGNDEPTHAVPGSDEGWATDPFGRFPQRYFKAGAWTRHVARDGATFSDPASYPAPPPVTQ